MRALGPGSVSSFLKIILDVVYIALVIGAVGTALLALAALLFAFNPSLLANVNFAGSAHYADRAPLVFGGLLAGSLYTTIILVIIGALRRIFVTLTARDPFQPENVNRLRLIGAMLATLELGRYAVVGISAWLPWVRVAHANFSLTAWFSVLVVFVLAEVFREGARLRREAELTI
jgi:hypothetical protein